MAENDHLNKRRQTDILQRTSKNAEKARQTPTTLTDLPNELLDMIVVEVDPRCHYTFSLVCRRLKHVALLSYLARRGIRHSGGRAMMLSHHADLDFAAVRVASFLDRLGRLDASVYLDNVGHTKNLLHLILQMSSVEFVRLLIYPGSGIPSKASSLSLAPLFDALCQKSCDTLCVSYVGLQRVDMLSNIQLRPMQSLRSVTIAADFLFRPPLLDWATSSINCSRVTFLDIKSCPRTLARVLPLLTLPNLSAFHVSCPKLPITILTTFLTRHPSISILKVQHRLEVDGKFSMSAMTALETVHADVPTLNHLLSQPKALPRLRAVRVVADIYPVRNESFVEFFQNLSNTSISHLYIPFFDEEEAEAWLESSKNHLLDRIEAPLTQIASLHLLYNGDLNGIQREISQWLVLFPNLKSVSFESCSLFALSKEDKLTFVEKLTIGCPHIEDFTLNSEGGTIDAWRAGTLIFRPVVVRWSSTAF